MRLVGVRHRNRAARVMEDKTFSFLIIAVSLAFAWILWPFYGAVLWATAIAILFAPLYRRLSRSMRQRRTLAAVATVLIVVLMVILPVALFAASLAQEASSVYRNIQSGELNFGRYFQQIFDALPPWAGNLLDRFGLTDIGAVQERLSAGLMRGSRFLTAQAINIGQNTFDFIVSLFLMLYLLFFLLRSSSCCATVRSCPGVSRQRFRYARSNNAPSSTNSPSSSAPRSRATSSWPCCKERSGA